MVCDHGHAGLDDGWATAAGGLAVWLAPFFRERSGRNINSYVQNLYVSDRWWCQDAPSNSECQLSNFKEAQNPLAGLSS